MCCCWVSSLPPSLLPTPAAQTNCAAAVISILKYLGLGGLADELLVTDGVHNLGNLLSLGTGLHVHFASLNLWFEGTDEVCN